MRRIVRYTILLIVLLSFLFPMTVAADGPVVRAVLFYSPTCPACHQVIDQVLPRLWSIYGGEVEIFHLPPSVEEEDVGPPLVAIYGEQMEILYVNILTTIGNQLFEEAISVYEIPSDDRAVPTLLVGEVRLLGAADIPNNFPDIITQGLAQGGIDWPAITGLTEFLGQLVPMPMEEPTPETPQAAQQTTKPTSTPVPASPIELGSTTFSPLDKLMLDPVGNGFAVALLIGMVLSVFGVAYRLKMQPVIRSSNKIHWIVALLAIAGVIIAGYLTYVETTGNEAFCGPIGDCNTVNQSKYATLFGFIPVGVLGLFGYLTILAAWLITRLDSGRLSDIALVACFGLCFLGTLFSIYLTFLEPFIIGVTCAWCLGSAVIITIQMVLTTDPAANALVRLR